LGDHLDPAPDLGLIGPRLEPRTPVRSYSLVVNEMSAGEGELPRGSKRPIAARHLARGRPPKGCPARTGRSKTSFNFDRFEVRC
jgi:hypothetical protein